MEKIKKTYEEANEIFNVLCSIDLTTQDKLSYSVAKLINAYKKIIRRYNDKVSDINIKHCFVDEKGVIQYEMVGEQKNYKFTKDELNKKIEAIQKLDQEEVEVPFYIYNGPARVPDVHISIKMILDGILFKLEEPKEETIFPDQEKKSAEKS